MTDKTYRQAFDQAKKDLAQATARRVRATAELKESNEDIVQLRRAITALAILCGEDVEDSMGLTDAVRAVARTDLYWTSKMFIDEVQNIGVSLADLKNPDASMLSVLNRLTAAGQLEAGTGKQGNEKVKIWRRKPSAEPMGEPVSELTDDDIPF